MEDKGIQMLSQVIIITSSIIIAVSGISENYS